MLEVCVAIRPLNGLCILSWYILANSRFSRQTIGRTFASTISSTTSTNTQRRFISQQEINEVEKKREFNLPLLIIRTLFYFLIFSVLDISADALNLEQSLNLVCLLFDSLPNSNVEDNEVQLIVYAFFCRISLIQSLSPRRFTYLKISHCAAMMLMSLRCKIC